MKHCNLGKTTHLIGKVTTRFNVKQGTLRNNLSSILSQHENYCKYPILY
uniref:Uncharacterized protein n=1 Tax=uncultured Desulfobacterales bacterium HF0200_07G10 TaxID=710741 RepID=E0XU23_9BACT|nr:hypothetical protein [uncultured Desulfobacterales bacterium HF0200_07G10]